MAGKFTPRSPAPCAHSTSATAASTSHIGRYAEPHVALWRLRRRSRRASGCRSTGRLRPAPDRRSAWACRAPTATKGIGSRFMRAVEDHAGRHTVVVVVGEPSGGVVVAGGAEVRMVEVSAALEHRDRSLVLGGRLGRRSGRTRRGTSTGSRRGDPRPAAGRCACRWRRRRPVPAFGCPSSSSLSTFDDRPVDQGMTSGMRSQPRTVDVGASSMSS